MGAEEKVNPNSVWYKKRHPILSVSGGSIAVEGEGFWNTIKEFLKRIIKKWLT
jgi:hypothetical protein